MPNDNNATDTQSVVQQHMANAGFGASYVPDHRHNGNDSPYVSTVLLNSLPTVDVAHGGTGDTTLAAHEILVGNGTGTVNLVGTGTTGQVLTSNGASADPTFQAPIVNFGNGSDGALDTSSGGTSIDAGNANILTKNYTSINIAASTTLNFTNTASSGTLVIFLCEGTATIAGTVNLKACGGIGGTKQTYGGAAATDGTGCNTLYLFAADAPQGLKNGTGGAGYTNTRFYFYSPSLAHRHMYGISPGSGGGGGSAGLIHNGGTGTGGDGGGGGNGGGALLLICKSLNFTGTVDVSGVDGGGGTNGTLSGVTDIATGGGGGGGGSGGWCVMLYQTLTANSGTVTISGGNGGHGGNSHCNTNVNLDAGTAAGGAGMYNGAGGGGGAEGNPNGSTGGNGANSKTTGSGGGTGGTGGLVDGGSATFSSAPGGGGGGTAGEVIITQYIP